MAESDEWATVETVDDGVESATMYSGLGPKGVQQSISEKSRLPILSIQIYIYLLISPSQ